MSRASVTVPGASVGNSVDELVGAIGYGLCVFVGVTHDDGPAEADRLSDRLAGLRIMDDADGVIAAHQGHGDAGEPITGGEIQQQFVVHPHDFVDGDKSR